MTNEELEQKVKRLEEQLTEVRIELLERKADKKPYKVEAPEDVENYYYVDETGLIERLWVYDIYEQIEVFKRGLAFKTKEEAEQFDKERILINKLNDWAKKHQGDWTPDWENCENKYIVKYIHETRGFEIAYTWSFNYFSKLPVFKSEELCYELIREFGDEIKEVLF